jgi:L-alanine-DL-glutamate epimerase-like enolase superfamily enzyme
MATPKIAKVEVKSFTWDVKGIVHARAFHYDPGSTLTFNGSALRITADNGAVGEYAGWHADPQAVADAAQRYLGQSALDRERFYQAMKNSPIMAVYDIALWDLAGKMTGLPVYALIGAYRTRVPAYASTIDGAVTGPLSTPESFADFAEECLQMGYRGFKIHPMAWPDVRTHVEAIRAVGKRVGGKMDTMIDPYCLFPTFADALKIGRACDEAGFFWLEDPYSDGGVTPFSHARLRELIRTPLLQGEQVATVEQRMALVLEGATDFVRADLGRHGLTGSLKLAHAAESVGIDIEPHRSGPAELHFLAAVKNANYYEVVWVHPVMRNSEPPIYANAAITGLDCIDGEGMVAVPDGPGLGIEYDWDYIDRHATGTVQASL